MFFCIFADRSFTAYEFKFVDLGSDINIKWKCLIRE